MKKKVYFENLDALRFFCFLSVFFYHSFHTEYNVLKELPVYRFIKIDLFGNGNLGVNFFFVLSGFLITYLLIDEKKLNGHIDIKRFWMRRVLRIWPLFYFCVLFGFFIFPVIKSVFGQVPDETATLWKYILFINNFDFIEKGLPDASILGVLWSIAVEEQFYLLWPVVLYFVPLSSYWFVFAIIIASSLLFRAFNDTYVMHEFHTLSCIGDMSVGAMGAWLVSEFTCFKMVFVKLGKKYIAAIYFVFAFVYFFRDDIFYSIYGLRVFERGIISVVILFIIMEQNYSQNSFFKLKNFKVFSRLGVISYGLYCLHFIGILIATNTTKLMGWNTQIWQVLFLDTFLALAITVVIAYLSYKYYEKPFLRLKDKFSYFNIR